MDCSRDIIKEELLKLEKIELVEFIVNRKLPAKLQKITVVVEFLLVNECRICLRCTTDEIIPIEFYSCTEAVDDRSLIQKEYDSEKVSQIWVDTESTTMESNVSLSPKNDAIFNDEEQATAQSICIKEEFKEENIDIDELSLMEITEHQVDENIQAHCMPINDEQREKETVESNFTEIIKQEVYENSLLKYEDSDSNNDITLAPSNVRKQVNRTTKNLLPEISRKRYEIAYKNFIEWQSRNNAHSFSEHTLLTYFEEKCTLYKSSTAWSIYSMLRGFLVAKHNVNMANYTKLRALLKRKSHGYRAKKSKTLDPEQIKEFIQTAPDEKYLMTKVALIFGVTGAMRKSELCRVKLSDISELNSTVLIRIPVTEKKTPRSFSMSGQFYQIYKKYAELRPSNFTEDRFFVNYQNGKCKRQFVGINKFGNMVKDIAKFLKLANPESYTGHSFRRSSATIFMDSDGALLALKNQGVSSGLPIKLRKLLPKSS